MKLKKDFTKAVRRTSMVTAIAVGLVAATTVGNASTADWKRTSEIAYSEMVPYEAIVTTTQDSGQVNGSGPNCTDIPIPAGRSVTIKTIRTTLVAYPATPPYVTIRHHTQGHYNHYPIELDLTEDWSGAERLYSKPMNLTLHIGPTEAGYMSTAQICIAHTGMVSNATVTAYISGYAQPDSISFQTASG